MHTIHMTLWQRSRSLLEVKGDFFLKFYLASAITSQVIVIYLSYLVNMFTIICRCVAYKTRDSMSNVKVTESKRQYKCFDIWAQHVAPGHLFQRAVSIKQILILVIKFQKLHKNKN